MFGPFVPWIPPCGAMGSFTLGPVSPTLGEPSWAADGKSGELGRGASRGVGGGWAGQ